MKKTLSLALIFLFAFSLTANAAPAYNQTVGLYEDDFADNTGLVSRVNTNVNTITGVLQLTKSGSQTLTEPNYYTSGTAYVSRGYISSSEPGIIPESISQWQNITFDSNVPAGTSIKIQIADSGKTLFSDDILPGNSTGFTSSPVDISNVPVLAVANSNINTAKSGRITIKITLNTTDTSITPSINNIRVSWIGKSGVVESSQISPSGWPNLFNGQKGLSQKEHANESTYSVVKWADEKTTNTYRTNHTFYYNGKIYYSDSYSLDGKKYLKSKNPITGQTEQISELTSSGRFVIDANGVGYLADTQNDSIVAVNMANGAVKWSYSFESGHGVEEPIIGADGTIYVVRSKDLRTILVYAFNPDGSIKWNETIDDIGANNGAVWFGEAALNNNTLYFGTSIVKNMANNNNGQLYSVNLSTKTLNWKYGVGDMAPSYPIIIDEEGTIYTKNFVNAGMGLNHNIYAINPNGTVKWSIIIPDGNYDNYNRMILRKDGVLISYRPTTYDDQYNLTEGLLTAIDSSTGEILWTKSQEKSQLFSQLSFQNNYSYATGDAWTDTDNDWEEFLGYYDSNFNNKWKLVFPYEYVSGSYKNRYSFSPSASGKAILVANDNGWIFGAFGRSVWNASWQRVNSEQWVQHFAMAPWTLTSTKSVSSQRNLGQIDFTVTTSMMQTNPLFEGANKVQIVMDNNDIVALSYSSTNGNGDTIWTGSYTIPENMTPGRHSYTVEASQAYMRTDIPTTFASAPTESNNTGIKTTGSFVVLSNTQKRAETNTTVTAEEKEIAVISQDSTSITIPKEISDATINVSSLITSSEGVNTATLPEINVTVNTNNSPIELSIPSNTTASSSTEWTGIINVPQVKENSTVSISNAEVNSVTEVGYGDVKITFDKAVRILIPNQAGKRVGYSRGNTFTEITTTCQADSQATANALPAEGDCKIEVGQDMIIWTKHFTKFATYTPVSSRPSSGSSRSVAVATPTPAKTGMPQPAKPIAQMTQTEKNSYVMELQQFLIQLLTQLLTLLKK